MKRLVLGAFFLFLFLVAGLTSKALERNSFYTPSLNIRFCGLFRAMSDIIWVRISQDIPFLLRVDSRESELNFHRARVAARLNPENLEPYRYGVLGLSLWGRNDLALKLGREGLRKHPEDRMLNMMMYSVVSQEEASIKESIEFLNEYALRNDPMNRFFLVLKAMKEKKLGMKEDAVRTLHELIERFPEEIGIVEYAREELKRLNS